MNKKIIPIIGFCCLVLASCGDSSVSDAQATYCQELAKLEQALANLRGISANSTVKDLKQAQQEVRSAFANVKQAASKLKEVQVEQLETSQQNLEKAVSDIPDDATLAEALTSVTDQVKTFGETRQKLFSSANCNAQ